MKIKIFVKSIIGKSKKNNQDFFVIKQNENNQILIAIADGVGSYKNSRFASEISCEILKKEFLKFDFSKFSNNEIIEWGKEKIKKNILSRLNEFDSKIATTLTFFVLINKFFYVFHVGNTRFYQFKKKNEKLFQITNDHDFRTDKDQIFSFVKGKEFLSNSVSNISDCYIDIYKIFSYPGQYLLTTDGIHSFIKKNEIEKILKNNLLSLNEKVELIYENSIFNGSLDDKTIILFEII